MAGFDQYDPDGDVHRFLDFSQPAPLFLPPPPPAPAAKIDGEISAPARENVPFWNFDFIGSLIEGMGSLVIHDGNPRASSRPNVAAVKPTIVSIRPEQLDCKLCHVLRETVHFNGLQRVKSAVHGALGVFKHAIFQLESFCEGSQPLTETVYIDLSNQNFDWVKSLLTHYSMLLEANGCIVVQDSVSSLFDALCGAVGSAMGSTSASGAAMGSASAASGASSSQPPEPELGGSSQNSGKEESQSGGSSQSSAKGDPGTGVRTEVITETEGSGGPIKPKKTGIAAQRERATNMGLKDMMDYFHLPIKRASEELKLCSTSLKNICRKYGLSRWPSRKIRSIDRQITTRERELQDGRGDERVLAIREEIEKLREKRARLYAALAA